MKDCGQPDSQLNSRWMKTRLRSFIIVYHVYWSSFQKASQIQPYDYEEKHNEVNQIQRPLEHEHIDNVAVDIDQDIYDVLNDVRDQRNMKCANYDH